MSSKMVPAEYDAAHRVLRLGDPLKGVADHATVYVMVEEEARGPHPWDDLRGSLSKEAGDELAALVEEMFPIER